MPLTTTTFNADAAAQARMRRRTTHVAKQAAIVLAAAGVLVWLAVSIRAGLERNGIGFDMGFLGQPANFEISEATIVTWAGLRQFSASDTNAVALWAGFINTVKVSAISIALATVLGVLVGMGRVSHNWLVRQLSFGLVEFVRNTPMLIQLVFWYFAVVLKLPAIADASVWLGGVIASQQGLFVPAVALQDVPAGAILATLVGATFALGAIFATRARTLLAAIGAAGFAIALGIGIPVHLSTPHLDGFTVEGGWSVSPEFAALLLGLSVYTSAFIAEIVRGAILALPRGQWEAAAALGLSRRFAFRDIVIPQAFRVVLPAFGNQYISLAKSTSLGIAIGYSDLFNVYGTVANQSGRSLEAILAVMLAYLALSWVISGAVNMLNGRLLRAGGAR